MELPIKEIQELKEILGFKQDESLEIEKNSRGYNWKYKLYGNVENTINTRIDNIEQELKKRYDKQEPKKEDAA